MGVPPEFEKSARTIPFIADIGIKNGAKMGMRRVYSKRV